jgi:hypothetical protein
MSEVAHTSEGVAQPAKLGGANQVAIACSAVEATLMSPERWESLLMLLMPAERALGRGCTLALLGGSTWLRSRDSSYWIGQNPTIRNLETNGSMPMICLIER